MVNSTRQMLAHKLLQVLRSGTGQALHCIGLVLEQSLLVIDRRLVQVVGKELRQANLFGQDCVPLFSRQIDILHWAPKLLSDHICL